MLTAPLPTPDGTISDDGFDPNEFFILPWKQAPWIIRCAAYQGALLLGLFAVLSIYTGVFPSVKDDLNSTVCITAGSVGLVLVFYLRWGLKRHLKAAWRLQAAVCLLCVFLFPIGTLPGMAMLFEWDARETRAWFGLPPSRRKRKRKSM